MRRSSWVILAAAGLLHLGLLIGWRWQLPLVPYFFDATVLSGGRGLDFYSIYQAGYNARHGWDIYEIDPANVQIVVPYFTPYRYLPIVAYTVGAALSLMTPLTAYKLWVVVLEVTLLGCAAAMAYHARRDRDRAARVTAMWLVFTPYYAELFMGQFSLVQAALILGMLLAASRASASLSEVPARGLGRAFDGLWISSVLWKINTVVFAPVMLRLGRWRALLAAGALVALTTLPYFAAFPTHGRDLIANNIGQTVAGHELGNLGFRQLVFEVLATLGAGVGVQRAAQWAVVAGVGGAALALTFQRGALRTLDLLCLWIAAYFLAAPQVWEHHYVMLLPAVVMAYAERPGRWLLAMWLLLALPTPFGLIGLEPVIAANHDLRAFALEPAWQPILQHAAKSVPALGLFSYWVMAFQRPERAAIGSSVSLTS
jgi:hypothetical protein